MTFEIPDDVADRFSSEVPVADQSSEVTRLMRRHLFGPFRPTLTDEEWKSLNTFDHAADDAWLVALREEPSRK